MFKIQISKLTFLWYDNFVENHTPLHRNGMTALPKIIINNDTKCTFQQLLKLVLNNLVLLAAVIIYVNYTLLKS